MNGPPARPYRLWQVVVIFGMLLLMGKMIFDLDGIRNDAIGFAAAARPMFDLARDVRSDIGKSTLYVTHDKIFELHRFSGETAKYSGASGAILRETDSGTTAYAISGGSIQFGMDYGMIIAKVSWHARFFVFGAPPGWAITREEMLSQ